MDDKVYCTTMKLLAALFLLTGVDCKSLVNQKTLLEHNTDQNPIKRINTKDAKPSDVFTSPLKNQANKRLSNDYFNMAEIMYRMWDKDDYSDNNRESLLRTPIYHAYDEEIENENTYRDDIQRDKLLSNEHKRKYRNVDDEYVDLIDLTRQGSDFARLNADDRNIIAKPTESDCKKILNKILLILLQYLNKPDEPLSEDEILRNILLTHLGRNKHSLKNNNSKVKIDTVDLTRGGSSNYDPSTDSTSDKNDIIETVLKVKQLLQSKITVNVGDIVDVIIKHTRPVLIKTGQELCKNLAMEYLISSVNEAYEQLLNSTTCSDAYKKNNNVTFEKKMKKLANVIESLQSDELTKLILSTNLSDYLKAKVRNIIDESDRISKENDIHGLQDKSNLADHRNVRSRERSKKRSSDKFLRQVLFNTVHSKIIEEQCDKTAIDTFLKTMTLIILRAKNMKCTSFAKKNKSPILRSEVKELLFNDQNYVTEDDYDMFDSIEEVRQAIPRTNIVKDILLNPKTVKILDNQKMGKTSNELNNVFKLINNDSIKYSNLLQKPSSQKFSQRRPSFNLLKKYFSYFEQESGLTLNGMNNTDKVKEENIVPNLQQLPNNNYRGKYNEITKETLDGTDSTDHLTSSPYVDGIIQELAGNAANIYEPRNFPDDQRNEKNKILEKIKPTASNMEKPKLYKYQPNNHQLKFSKGHKHSTFKFLDHSSQDSANRVRLLPYRLKSVPENQSKFLLPSLNVTSKNTFVKNPLHPDQLKVRSDISTVKEFDDKEKEKDNFINYDSPYSHDEIKGKIIILPEKAIVDMKNLSAATDKTFQNLSTKSYSPLITFDYYLNGNDDENVFPVHYKDDILLKSSNNYRKHKSDENDIAEYLKDYLERTRGNKSNGADLSNVEPSSLRITEVPKSVKLKLNNLPLPYALQKHLNKMKNLAPSSRDENFTSVENVVELTYIIRHPEVIMYQPLTKIKFNLPYKYYTENKKQIFNEVQNKEQFRLVKVVKLLSKGNEVLYETKDPESSVLIFNRETLNFKPANVKAEKNIYNTNVSLQRNETEIGAEIYDTEVINDKSNNTSEGDLKDLINVLAETDISKWLDKNESKADSLIDNADNNRTSEINSFGVDSTEFSNFQSKNDGHNDKLHMNIDGKIVWNDYPISNKKYTPRKSLIYPYNSRAYKNIVTSHSE